MRSLVDKCCCPGGGGSVAKHEEYLDFIMVYCYSAIGLVLLEAENCVLIVLGKCDFGKRKCSIMECPPPPKKSMSFELRPKRSLRALTSRGRLIYDVAILRDS